MEVQVQGSTKFELHAFFRAGTLLDSLAASVFFFLLDGMSGGNSVRPFMLRVARAAHGKAQRVSFRCRSNASDSQTMQPGRFAGFL